MSKPNSIYLGVMSGTSLDGVDVVAASFAQGIEIHHCQSFELPRSLRQQILELCQSSNNEIEKMGRLDVALGQHFANCCLEVIRQLSPIKIHAIGLHGQTIRHRPELGKLSFSLQIGDANTVCEITSTTTVADFRRRDIAAGGQGAPLVPAFHQDLFACSMRDRVIINIGGMSNITVLAKDPNTALLGFDTGPGNVLMDSWIQHIKQVSFDAQGGWAASGNIHNELLHSLSAIDFFELSPPKSTGREQFNLSWLQQKISACQHPPSAEDVQRTLLELTASTICNDIKRMPLNDPQLFICGGGARNCALLTRIAQLMGTDCQVETTSGLGLDPDWVEAAAFAWLAKQTLAGAYGNSSTVTGAAGQRILGAIYQA